MGTSARAIEPKQIPSPQMLRKIIASGKSVPSKASTK